MTIYDFSATSIDGKEIQLEKYKGKTLIIANTASKCGFTPQYEDLQKLYEQYKEDGLEILGFPCNQFEGQEPDANEAVHDFCSRNYGVSFQLFSKIEVRDENAHPLFNYLIQKSPFKGFDLTHPIGKILQSLLQEKHPHFLLDDSIKWNFTKFLIDREGHIVGRYEPTTSPLDMEEDIKKLLYRA